MSGAEEVQTAHLCLHVVDVWREAEDDFGVVGVVFAVPDADLYIQPVLIALDQHSGWKIQIIIIIIINILIISIIIIQRETHI